MIFNHDSTMPLDDTFVDSTDIQLNC